MKFTIRTYNKATCRSNVINGHKLHAVGDEGTIVATFEATSPEAAARHAERLLSAQNCPELYAPFVPMALRAWRMGPRRVGVVFYDS